MQIADQVQAEIMEILADDEMKHAEAPSDEEMEQMFTAAEDPDWAKERQMQEMGVLEFEERVRRETQGPTRYHRNNYSGEELDEVERMNANH